MIKVHQDKTKVQFLIWANPHLFLCMFVTRHLQLVTVQINNQKTFPLCSVVFISGFFSQRENVLGTFAPLQVTVHLSLPLMPTTVDSGQALKSNALVPLGFSPDRNIFFPFQRSCGCRKTFQNLFLFFFSLASPFLF